MKMKQMAKNYLMSLASMFAFDSMSNRQNSKSPLRDARCSAALSLQKQISNWRKANVSLILDVSSINVCICCKKQPKHFDLIILNAEMESSLLAVKIKQRGVIFKPMQQVYFENHTNCTYVLLHLCLISTQQATCKSQHVLALKRDGALSCHCAKAESLCVQWTESITKCNPDCIGRHTCGSSCKRHWGP